MTVEDESGPRVERSLPESGRMERVAPLIRRRIAPNGGPFTATGTCTYVVGQDRVAIIDPGPDDPGHIAALLDDLGPERVEAIVVTHTHRDHSPGARLLAARTGAPIVGCGPHRAACALPEADALFSGDHVMAWNTTIVAPPDGEMRAYMASLEKLRGRTETTYWPGHGGPVQEPARLVRCLIGHRRQREAAIRARLAAGDTRIPEVVAAIYQGLDPRLRGAAALSVFAHLEDLVGRGLVACDGPPRLDATYAPA
ncbi:MBL fold metallo-hydrolase [Methylobacterium sp. WL18]|uniref:MBL fold metallo-hydrolase n=1 Tax=Methylobacterium sp. WL18 TaxID=2603897 RepID=UPI0011CC9E42|nr:MBL fold metallo-hydrolase [Methylobacterium sp. WL18]TXN68203.1 MBL fold metallo-hydrolase [Methylobacterium sp. WL18]